MIKRIKCNLEETNRDLIARIEVPTYVVLVPPSRAEGLQMYTNEYELKEYVKKVLSEAVDNMEIVL